VDADILSKTSNQLQACVSQAILFLDLQELLHILHLQVCNKLIHIKESYGMKDDNST
jgi:hypothetical protein